MSRTRALLRYGLWPDIPMTGHPASSRAPVELTAAARAQAIRAIGELNRLGVSVTLDNGKARFRLAANVRGAGSLAIMPTAARRIVEKLGDVIEACLQQERTP